MTSSDFKIVADGRVEDARVMLSAGHWSTAYYLIGYAVECALKACAATQFQQHDVPDKSIVNRFYQHDLGELLSISGVKKALEDHSKNDGAFALNWAQVKNNWDVDDRYDHSKTEAEASELFKAVTDLSKGVLPWLKAHW
jgi:hypothetical protein